MPQFIVKTSVDKFTTSREKSEPEKKRLVNTLLLRGGYTW